MISSSNFCCAPLRRARGERVRAVRPLFASIAAVPLVALAGAQVANAANLYWDGNGPTVGAGTAPAGAWSGVDAMWNDQVDGGDGLGSGVIGPWINGSTAVLSAGTDAVGPFAVTVGGTPSVAGIIVEEGDVSVSGSGLDISGGGGTTINAAAGTKITVTSAISGAGGRLTKTGAGTLDFGAALNNPNTFDGGVTLSGGLTIIPGENSATGGAANALGAAPGAVTPGYLVMENGATLRSMRNGIGSSFVLANRGITLNAGGAVFDVANAAADLVYTGKITGAGGFVKTGAGQLRLSSTTNDFTGDLQVQQGTLGIGSTTTVIGTGTLRLQGGNMMYAAARTLTNPLSIEADVTFSNTASAVSAGRTMGFSSNSISGTAGTVRIRNLSTAPNPTAPPIAVLRFTGGGFDFGRPVVIGDAADVAGALSRLEFLTDTPTAPQTFSGVISGPGVLRRTNNVFGTGGDTLLTGVNTYAGGTEINGGFFGVGSDSAAGTGAIVMGSPGSTDDVTGFFAHGGPRTLANNVVMGTQNEITFKGTENLTFTGTMNLANASRNLTPTGAGVLTFANTISGDAGIGIVKNGTGTLALSGSNTYTGATTVNAGRLVIGATQTSSASLTINNDAVTEVAATATGATVIKTGPVTIGSGAKLDLKNNKLVTTDAPGTFAGGAYDGVAGKVDAARGANATWDGFGITTSDTRAVGTSELVSIGVAKAGDAKNIADGATTTFGGQTVLGTDTLAMVTWGGDANLDGKINIDDYGLIDANVSKSGSVFGWNVGDFNYDGVINIDDYGIIDGNINRQDASFSAAGMVASATTGLAGVSAVPEPASLSLIALGASGLLRRRRRA